MAKYYMDSDGNVTKKKKKPKYHMDEDGKVTKLTDDDDDIAPSPISRLSRDSLQKSLQYAKTGKTDTDRRTSGGKFYTPPTEEEMRAFQELADSYKGDDAGLMAQYKKGMRKGSSTEPAYLAKNDVEKNAQNKQKETEKGFFKKGAFDDGYQFGDVTKTVGSTLGDAGVNVAKGIGNMTEGVTDLVQYGVAAVADKFGADDFADDLKRVTKRNVVNDFIAPAENKVNKNSVLADTSDAVAQGVGQVAGIILTGSVGGAAGLGAKGVSALTTGTMFASGTGSGMGEAYQSGATDGEAVAYGVMSGAADALTEMIFGGLGKSVNAVGFSRGLSSADDMLAKALTQKITNTLVKNTVQLGVKMTAEGLEEVAAGFLQAAAKDWTYMDGENEEKFSKILQDENLLEQFIVGALASGFAQAPGYVNSTAKGRDYITGLNKNEQAVVDRMTEERIKEAEKDGKKLTAKEKNKLSQDIIEELDRGGFSTDFIEETLVGDDYKAWKDSIRQEKDIKDEYDKLAEIPESDLSRNQRKRLDELEKIIDSVKKNEKSTAMRRGVDEAMKPFLKDSRLAESYNEAQREYQALNVDTAQYKDDYAKKSIENLVGKKKVNNAYRGRQFAERIAKLASRSKQVVSFTTNEELKTSDYAFKPIAKFKGNGTETTFDFKHKSIDGEEFFKPIVKVNGKVVTEGYTIDFENGTITFDTAPTGDVSVQYQKADLVNGYRTKDGITINLDSKQMWEFTAAHELTHSLEKTEAYKAYRKAIIQYAKYIDVYDAMRTSREGTYNEGTDIDGEIAADLGAQYVFTEDFANNLASKERNVAQKILDWIKHQIKMVTAGSPEARQLEQARYLYEKALDQAAKGEIKTRSKYAKASKRFNEQYAEWHNEFVESRNQERQETELETDEYLVDDDTASENPYADLEEVAREFSDADTQYSIRTDPPPKKTIEGYKVFIVKDGKLYPPMVANPEGEGTPVGVWLDADVGGLAYDADGNVQLNNRGRFKVKAGGKGTQGGSGELAFRPGWHLGEYPDASQFGRENQDRLVPNKKGKMVHPKELFPYNFVWARCDVAADNDYQLDAMSFGVNEKGGYERTQAGLPYIPEDGYYKYRTNPNPDTAPWIISGSIKVVEILDDDQVAQICAEHGVTPQQRQGFTPNKKGTGYKETKSVGGKIDLSMFGLQSGEVTPTTAEVLEQIKMTEGTAKQRKAETAELLKTLPGYAKRQINFDDPNIAKEFAMNNQSIDEYRVKAEESSHGYLNDDKIYSGDVQYSITAEEDAEYMDAYFDGDDDKMQELVDRVADRLGYKYKAYHRTENAFTVFDLKKARRNEDIQGFYFSADKDAEREYGSVRYDTYLKMENPYIVDSKETQQAIPMDRSKGNAGVIAREWLIAQGYDGVIRKAEYFGSEADEYIVFDSNQIKSAEPMTFADDEYDEGDVIPLSERFDATNDDIRYSISTDSDGRQLSDSQQRYFKDSKARDDNGALKVLYHGTEKGGFTEFAITDDIGYFFTDSIQVARTYSDSYEGIAPMAFRRVEEINKFFTEIGSGEHSVIERDGEFVLMDDGEEIATSDSLDGIYDEWRDWTGLGYGNVNYEVYLDIKNPLIINGNGSSWENVIDHTGTMVTYDELTEEQIEAIADEMGIDPDEIYDVTDDYGTSLPVFDIDNNWINYPQKTREWVQDAVFGGYDGVIFKNIQDDGKFGRGYDNESNVYVALRPEQIKSVNNTNPTSDSDIRYSLTSELDGAPIENDRIIRDEYDTQYSLSRSGDIAEGQQNYLIKNPGKAFVTDAELEEAQRVTKAMVDVMMKYSSILPEDKIGKVLTKNGSYDRSVENTTICVRTLAYNEFVDKVQEEIGRPLTQMESFLVSQKLYDIATEPQCLYCYVSLDRKSFNEMLLRYMQDRDTVIAKYNSGKWDDVRTYTEEQVKKMSPEQKEKSLFVDFLNGRKATKEMAKRFSDWLKYADNGTQLLSLADIATNERQTAINDNGGILAEQLKEARKYAQSASWSKIQKDYVAYKDEILKLGDRVVKNLNEHYGMRWYSFSDYSAAFIVENMQQITDASIRGLKGLSYTKDTDYAEIFAPSGMNINISVFVNRDADGNFYIDEKQSANFEKALELRDQYPNVGIVATVTDDEGLRWAASQEWSDVIIPFHIVRTGTDVAEYYNWLNYTSESGDTIKDGSLWDAYVDSLNLKSDAARRKVSKNIYPSEHKNSKETYLNLCESRGLTPRFARFAGEEWYMKLVNETRLSADATPALKPIFNEDAAKASFEKFIDKGGYEGGWYRDGVDVDAEARIVADDVLAGKKANEVDYGRQDRFNPEAIMARRKKIRNHGQHSLYTEDMPTGNEDKLIKEEHPIRDDIAVDKPTNAGTRMNLEWLMEDDEAETEPTISPRERMIAEDDITPTTQQLAEAAARERLEALADPNAQPENEVVRTVKDREAKKLQNYETELENKRQQRATSYADFDADIAKLQAEYDALKNKNTQKATNLLNRIDRTRTRQANIDAMYEKRISDLEGRIKKMNTPVYKRATQAKAKHEQYRTEARQVMGDTSTWRDKKLGISYSVNTLARNLRDIVRDSTGKQDLIHADEIYEWLQGTYNHNEAELNRESARIKNPFAEMKITKHENVYAQMLGELRHNPDTELTADYVNKYYQKHKKQIDTAKVDQIIDMARETYDSLLQRVNAVLREQGMKEIPYRKGYFPHFTNEKQGILGKLFNWKTKNDDIPTDIAGLTEQFNPNRSWQSFNKRRTTDDTDYNFAQGLDSYVRGALDWIYHIEDIQKRRAFENEIRYVHSEQGIKDRIEALKQSEEYDADELQEQIDLVYNEARNPLNNFVQNFRTATNTLAGKKSSMDRGMEAETSRKIYSVMTNVSNRVNANMVVGSISSALTNFIPITQGLAEVNPVRMLGGMAETLRNIVRDDGAIEKSDFLTNRLRQAENLYKTGWDKASDKAGILMNVFDNFTSQTLWRSKYRQNLANGMSESEAIHNADRFTEGVMAGRSRGNMPTIFDSKNPLIKVFTAFQLEVANQYGYAFKDVPQNVEGRNHAEKIAKLTAGYMGMFFGAYAYNALFSQLTGRNSAFDPIRIVQELLADMGFGGEDDEEETDPLMALSNFTDNVMDELPFVSGLSGGGRIPLANALPYGEGVKEAIFGTLEDWTDEDMTSAEKVEKIGKEWLNPLYYVAMPFGGGQFRKTVQGLSMFDDDLPISGSYTDSGALRYPVEKTPGNVAQAALFGQYANKNARDYFDRGQKPLEEKQINEFIDADMPIQDYWDYRDGLKGLTKAQEKADYINSLDIPLWKKNLFINNLLDRKEEINMENYDDYGSLAEFDFANENPDKYEFFKQNGISYEDYDKADEKLKSAYSWAYENPGKYEVSKTITSDLSAFKQYTKALSEIRADKDASGKAISGSSKAKKTAYIDSLPLSVIQKQLLFKYTYKTDDSYNKQICEYIIGQHSSGALTEEQARSILTELDFTIDANGNIWWD